MNGLAAARQALAQAVTDAGLDCLPYPPDALNPPIAFVDQLDISYDTMTSYTLAPVVATVVTCGQRHDKTAATELLEGGVGPVVGGLRGLPGVRVVGVRSGQIEIGSTELPAVVYTVTFQLDEES